MFTNTKKPVRYQWTRFFQQAGPHIAVRLWEVAGEEANLPHSHEFLELCIVMEGEIPHQTIHGVNTLKKGDLVILRPGSWHAFGITAYSTGHNICFDETVLRNYVPFIFYDPYINNLLLRAPSIPPNRGVFFANLNDSELQQTKPMLERLTYICKYEEKSDYFIELIGLLLACLGIFSKLESIDSDDIEMTPTHPSTKNIINQIELNLLEPISLESLAKNAKISKSYAANLFRRDTGKTISEYILHRRGELAASLLLCTDKTISEIAFASGWDDPNYFSRCFKKLYGTSPGDYRKHISSNKLNEK